ncbi:hypothetical protein LTR08_004490 [Meristemomyces frigidus]|nr:hypothetical protein LTR08_004490 [Meristemomyces frigidus]
MANSPPTLRPSLERLKALDTLPDLSSQLVEARHLCTHSARADMILKWLLEKLKTSEAARTSEASWALLDTILRLIPPERLATLLGTSDVIGMIQSSIQELHGTDELLLQISGCVNLLLLLASGKKGAPLLATLSVDAEAAAKLTGAWLTVAYRANSRHENKENGRLAITGGDMLQPAFQIWDQRKRKTNEDQLFADLCLAPAALLVTALSSQKDTPTGKRKRASISDREASGYLHALETLIAKHVFLPARTAFFKEQQAQRAGSSDLEARLARFQPLDSQLDSDAHLRDYYAAVPVVLDIALRCTSASTQQQRLKEKPWVEVLFAALLDTAPTPQTRALTLGEDLCTRMLSVVRKHATLSKQTLTKLIQLRGKVDELPDCVDWKLVEEVIKMDADVYIDREMAKTLFSDISTANMVLERDGTYYDRTYSTVLPDLWKDFIVPNVMQAFAKARDLTTFIDLWHEQLHQDCEKLPRCVWLEIGSSFGSLVEQHLTDRQIKDCMSRFHASVTAAGAKDMSSKQAALAQTELSASVVVLNGILSGVRSTELVDSLQVELDALFKDLLLLFKKDVPSRARCPQIWALCTRAFELWFPSWAAARSSKEAVVERVIDVESTRAVQEAQAFITGVRMDGAAIPSAIRSALEAKCFISTLSTSLRPYGSLGIIAACADDVASVVSHTDLQSLIELPEFLYNLTGDSRNRQIARWIGNAATLFKSGRDTAPVMDGIRAVIATAVGRSQTTVIEDFVCLTLALLEPPTEEDGEETDGINVLFVLQMLAEFPATSLSASQRERILDCATALEQPQYQTQKILQWRLQLMSQMLELSCPGAKLCTDTTVLWKLSNPAYSHEALIAGSLEPPHLRDEAKTVEHLERLADKLMKRLTLVQSQQSGQTALLKLASETMEHVTAICDQRTFSGNHRAFSILKVVLSHLHNDLRPDLREQCLQGDKVATYAKFLLRTAKKTFANDQLGDTPEGRHLPMVFSALLDLPKTVTEVGAMVDFTAKLTSRVVPILEEWEVLSTPIGLLTLLRCIQLTCHWNLSVDCELVTRLSVRLLDSRLLPREHAALLAALRNGYAIKSPDERREMMRLLAHFLIEKDAVTASKLTCLRAIIPTINLSDFDEPPPSTFATPSELFHSLLRVTEASREPTIRHLACACVVTVLKEKPFMTNQYTIEATLSTLQSMVRNAGEAVFLDACRIVTVLLQQYRSRLKDRLHLVVMLLQALVSGLNDGGKSTNSTQKRSGLSVRHAKVLARLLQLLCNPPQLRGKAKASDLVDEARKAQAHVGQYVQYVLHHYCAETLRSTPGEGVRDALMPGLWAMIEAIQVNDKDGVKSLSDAMDSKERDILWRVYSEYEAFGKSGGG